METGKGGVAVVGVGLGLFSYMNLVSGVFSRSAETYSVTAGLERLPASRVPAANVKVVSAP